MPDTFTLNVELVQPSQLYIDEARLARVAPLVDPKRPDLFKPIPIRKFGDTLVITDGHTRALAAWLRGMRVVPVAWEGDDLDWEAYEACVEWCREEGVLSVTDLANRVVSPAEFSRLWLDRCHAMQEDLENKRFAEAPPPTFALQHAFH